MKNQVLTIEQMEQSKELGIDISKASMCWIGCADGNDVYPYNSTFKDIFENHKETIPSVLTPTFTLQDILEMLPNIKGYYYPDLRQITKLQWQVVYKPQLGELPWLSQFGKTSIEAAFNMLKWCKKMRFLKIID